MAEQFYTILTAIGKARIANATALGNKVNFTTLKIGDSNGKYYNPTETQEDLINPVWQGNINSISTDEKNSNWIVIEVIIPSNIGGFTIREAGIFDDEGDLIAIGKYPETYKPKAEDGSTKDLIIKMILEVNNSNSVTLKVDPTVILATKKDIEVLENKIDNINIPVTSVNSKTGEVELKAEDIKTEDGQTVESELADMTKRLENIKPDITVNNKAPDGKGNITLNADDINETSNKKWLTNEERESLCGTLASNSDIIKATTSRKQINASENCSIESNYSQINSSNNCRTTGIYSQVDCCENSEAGHALTKVVCSDGVISPNPFELTGGMGDDSTPSSSNRKWRLDSMNGYISASGAIKGNQSFDFAEYFESVDGKSILSGTTVTLEGNKVRPCNTGEEMIGVISETAGVVLNSSDFCWQGRYLRNEFGGFITKQIPDKYWRPKEGQTESNRPNIEVKIENQEYIHQSGISDYKSRENRPEWNVVGLIGQIFTRIDETIKVGDFIKAKDGGIATKNENPTWQRWKVMKITTPYDNKKGYGVALVFVR